MLIENQKGGGICSVCGYEIDRVLLRNYLISFCPHCGQDLRHKDTYVTIADMVALHEACMENLKNL